MDVRVIASQRIATVLASAARTRLRAGAEQALTEPEREPLLADAEWPVEHERAWQRVAPDGVVEASAKDRMTVEWEQRHEEKLARLEPRSVGLEACDSGMVHDSIYFALHTGASHERRTSGTESRHPRDGRR